MQLDQELAEGVLSGANTPLLRLYRWHPNAVSLGYHQQLEDIDVEACHARGVDIVRRPTGGRAILHAEELTYSCIIPLDGSESGSASVIYSVVSRALVRGLRLFGVNADFQRSQPRFAGIHTSGMSIPCFTSSAKYEIEWRGRKLVGSAQRRFSRDDRHVVLQHGSILTGPSHNLLAQLLCVKDANEVDSIANELSVRTVDLKEITGTDVDMGTLGDCIKKGFEQEWEIGFDSADYHPIFSELKHA